MTADKLEATLYKTLRETAMIKTNWTMWNGLREKMQEGAEYEKLLEYSPCFWTVTFNNLLSTALIGTAKLYDEHKECMGIKKLINVCEQNKALFPKEHEKTYINSQTGEQFSHTIHKDIVSAIQEARRRYESVQEARAQLITLRDKHLAHTDKNVFLNAKAFYHEVALKKDALEMLVDTAADIVNSFLSNLSSEVVHVGFENEDDYKILLCYAKEGKEAHLQRIRAKRN